MRSGKSQTHIKAMKRVVGFDDIHCSELGWKPRV